MFGARRSSLAITSVALGFLQLPEPPPVSGDPTACQFRLRYIPRTDPTFRRSDSRSLPFSAPPILSRFCPAGLSKHGNRRRISLVSLLENLLCKKSHTSLWVLYDGALRKERTCYATGAKHRRRRISFIDAARWLAAARDEDESTREHWRAKARALPRSCPMAMAAADGGGSCGLVLPGDARSRASIAISGEGIRQASPFMAMAAAAMPRRWRPATPVFRASAWSAAGAPSAVSCV